MFLLVALAHLGILLGELPHMKQSPNYEKTMFLIIWMVVSTINLLIMGGVAIPSPVPLLDQLFMLLTGEFT